MIILENKKAEENKDSSFELKNFMKKKILGLYGINESKIEDVSSDPESEDITGLLPHDSTKI